MNQWSILFLIFAVRFASVFIVRTFYVPDEYWQSVEVAHKLAFGYGYLTWEWVQGLRSYIYPLIIAGSYKILAFLGLDNVHLLVILPRILQAALSAYSDYRFYVWAGKRKWALFLTLVSWYWFYTSSRTLTNTLETSLTTIALSYFPWYGESTTYLWLAAVCCFLRPTAAVIWIPLCIYHLRKAKDLTWTSVLSRFLIIGFVVGGACIAIDTYLYGKFIVTPYEFLKYNVFHNIGSFYGSHPWYWYFTTGLPTVLGITTLPFIFGVMETVRNRRNYLIRKQLLFIIALNLVILSTIDHKEFRFATSLLPFCLYISADALARWSYKASRFMLWLTALVLLVGNALPAWYLSTLHQRGPIEVMSKIQDIARNYRDENNHRANILFLMPCHSTPYYSHVHENVTMHFLTCEPNLENKPNYKDEADQFYESPVHFLRSHIPSYPRTATPSHVVLFEPLASKINEFLVNYKIMHHIANSEHVQPRQGKNILVYQRLRAGEENQYNRGHEESATKQTTFSANEDLAEDVINGFNADHPANEHNLFN